MNTLMLLMLMFVQQWGVVTLLSVTLKGTQTKFGVIDRDDADALRADDFESYLQGGSSVGVWPPRSDHAAPHKPMHRPAASICLVAQLAAIELVGEETCI